MNNQLTDYLIKNNLADKKQYGFKKKSNTTAAFFDLINYIQLGLSKRMKVSIIFFDLTKAFDTIDRKLLIRVLYECGVKDIELEWFKSYLSERKQYAESEKFKSNMLDVNYGVIQGSSLGPSLFSCYISSFSKLSLRGSAFLYADDIAVVIVEKTYSDLESAMVSDITTIEKWMNLYKLTVNVKKTKYMIFKNHNNVALNLQYNNSLVEEVRVFKYLGVWFDSDLKWNHQIGELAKTSRRIAGILKLTHNRIPNDIKKSIFYSLFHSTITYGIIAWGNTYLKNLNTLQKIQNKAIKNLYGYDRMTSTADMHKTLEILPIILQKKLVQAMQICSINNNTINTNTIIMRNNEVHYHNTRTASSLYLENANTSNYGLDGIFMSCINIFNKLPSEIKTLKGKDIRTQIKKYFLTLIK